MFFTGVNVNLPTTFQQNTSFLTSDLTSDFTVIGNVCPEAVDQWINHREQVESPGPFNEDYLYEQNENVVNSSFMTGAAFYVARDRFKSKLSDKTIIRIEKTLNKTSVLSSDQSAIHYLNPMSGGFDFVAAETVNAYQANADNSNDDYLAVIDPVLFTPYGYHYMPANGMVNNYDRGADVAAYMQTVNSYTGNGSESTSLIPRTYRTRHSASLLNPRHNANASQSIRMSDHISHPFLLEKAVIEFKVEAGPGWMNDAFQIRTVANTNPSLSNWATDAGGPMVTVALLKQDKNSNPGRDLIASATFTNALDALTASYLRSNARYFSGSAFQNVEGYTRSGVNNMINVGAVLAGPAMSSSVNFFTGTVKLILEPAITHHVMRYLTSGSAAGMLRAGNTSNLNNYNTNPPSLSLFGPALRRPNELRCGRSLLGNHITLLTSNQVTSDLRTYETDFDNQAWTTSSHVYKLYHDVVVSVARSPYLLYPEDEIILCLNKHRSVVRSGSMTLGTTRTVNAVTAQHDIKIPPCQLKITLYGDLIKEDEEFHDTLNQRLETNEIWETIGEESVLDQFDVTYASELSGTYLDRFNVKNTVNNIQPDLTQSLITTQYYSNFSQNTTNTWSNQYSWSNNRYIYELQKSTRDAIAVDEMSVFWDTRFPNPQKIATLIRPDLILGSDIIAERTFRYALATGYDFYGGESSSINQENCIYDWGMRYPFESPQSSVSQQFYNELISDVFLTRDTSGGVSYENINYNDIPYEVGPVTDRIFGTEDRGTSLADMKLFGLGKSEFIKAFFGIGDGVSPFDNQHVKFRSRQIYNGQNWLSQGVEIRGWKYGLMSAFPIRPIVIFRRNRFGQFRDMLEQRIDTKFYENSNEPGVKEGPVQVRFYDRDGNLTSPELTLSSNLSFEVTSSVPYCDGIGRNRETIDYTTLNISSVTF
jgi:hypothetical protein